MIFRDLESRRSCPPSGTYVMPAMFAASCVGTTRAGGATVKLVGLSIRGRRPFAAPDGANQHVPST